MSDETDELYSVDVDALLDLAAELRRDGELGFVCWGSARLVAAAETIEAALSEEVDEA